MACQKPLIIESWRKSQCQKKLEGKYCYFGRGVKQLTWAGNYNVAQRTLNGININGQSLDICKNLDSICDNAVVAFITAIAFWNDNNGDSITLSNGIEAAITQVVRPVDTASNGARIQNYNNYMKIDLLRYLNPNFSQSKQWMQNYI